MVSIPRAGMSASAIRSKLGMIKLSSATNDHKSPTSSSSPDLKARRERRDRRSKPWAQFPQSLTTSPSLVESESAATETPCTPSLDGEDTSSVTSSATSSSSTSSSATSSSATSSSAASSSATSSSSTSSSATSSSATSSSATSAPSSILELPTSTLLRQGIEEQLPRQLEEAFVAPRSSSPKLAGTADVEVRASSKPASVQVVTSQDYLEEGMKLMQMIRAKGNPVDESVETSKLNSDAIPSPDIDEISLADESSRPSKIPAPWRTRAAASRRYVAYAKATVTSTYRTSVRALTLRKTASVPRLQAGSSRAAFCKIGMHKPMDKTPIDKPARAMKAALHIGNERTPPPVLKSALKGGKLLYGHEVDKKLRFKCCARVYTVESWKEDLRRETWVGRQGDEDTDISDYSEDEPDYNGIAWLDQSQDPE